VWGVMQQRVYQTRVHTVDELKKRLKSGLISNRALSTLQSTSEGNDSTHLTEQMVDILSIFCKTSKSAEQI
jgi:hypothetical protein